MKYLENYLAIFGLTTLAWLVSLGILNKIKDLPRIWFVVGHYLTDIIVFGLVFSFYYKKFGNLPSFAVMAISMVSLFAIEFIFWNFIAKGSSQYLNFIDWVVPAFLIAAVIYFVGFLVR